MALMDVGASVIERLKNKSKETRKPLQLYLQLFCQEEFLRRLAASRFRDNLVLKGGLFIFCPACCHDIFSGKHCCREV